MAKLSAYTCWFRHAGTGFKRFYYWGDIEQMHQRLLDQGYQDIIIWTGNWFGLAPDNLPQPDLDYEIPEEKR